MSKYTATVTADGDTYLCTVNKKRSLPIWKATINAYGTWGSGTITFKVSTDGGTTKVPLQDYTGASITLSANGNFNTELGNANTNSGAPKLYATMAGSTNPSVTVDVLDNNG